MQRKNILSTWRGGLLALAALATLEVRGMTVAELQSSLAKGAHLTIIDVRSPVLFGHGHIPGAINVPASLCGPKNLPPLGPVVVCDAGLGHDHSDAAVLALNAKPGITAEVLDGGFAAWESAQATTTRPPGLHTSAPNYITYDQLKAAKMSDLVLVDLRSSGSTNHPKAKLQANVVGSQSTGTPTDLATEFPGARTTASPFAAMATGSGSATPPLLVLIDDGDGKAQAMAQTLQASGTKRYVILTGGELILSRHGQAGLKREGFNPSVSPTTPVLGGATK